MRNDHGFLAALGAADRAALAALGRRVTFENAQRLMRQGGANDAVLFIEDGLATVTAITRDGREVLLALLGPGDMAGELGVLDGRPRSATVAARGTVTAVRVTAADLRRFLRSSPDAAMALLRTLSLRLRQADRAQVELAATQTPVRVARRLLELAATHGELTEGRVVISLGLTQSELAAWVGASREGVSDALRTLRADGIIDTARRAISILDLEALRERALR